MKLPVMNQESLEHNSILAAAKKKWANTIPFLPFNMLDPNPIQSEQVYFASHLNFGAYHGGVVCNDVSTHTEFVEMPLTV